MSYLSRKAYDISQLCLQLQFSPPLSISSSQTCNNLIISEMSILKSASKFKRFQGGTKTPRHRQTDTTAAWSYQPKKNYAKNITDLMVNMKFMVLPSLQWPVQICVTLNGIILQDGAPWHGKANSVYYSGYTHTHRAMQTAAPNNTAPGQTRPWIGNDMQNSKNNVHSRKYKCDLSQERSLGLSCHGNF